MLTRVQYSFNILFFKIIVSWLFFLFFFWLVQEFYFINFSQTFKCPFPLQQDVIFSNALLPFSYPLTWINSRCWLVRVEEKGFSCLKENILRTVTIEMIGKFSSLSRLLPLYTSLLTSLSLFSCFHLSSRIVPSWCCTHKRIAMYIFAHKILYLFVIDTLTTACLKSCVNFFRN